MKITKSDINREGFAVLHGKWGGNKAQTIIGVDGEKIKNYKLKIKNLAVGYFAYPNPTIKNDIPVSRFYKYDKLKIVRQNRRRTNVCPPSVDGVIYKASGKLEQSVTKSEYIKKIKQVKELLADGEIYQLNYAIRFRKKFTGDPYALFLKLIEANPGDFSAYINCGKFQIISSSPERLFKVENGKIITQPIKGTAPKDSEFRIQNSANICGLNPESRILNPSQKKEYIDQNLLKLINSNKERAELDMITDLERNDVGKICKYGTLKLAKEREILELKNIWHTYSQVEGQLPKNTKSDEIIKAMFPGGSITGCPKKRAMEYIEQLENLPRNIFTGSIGYISNGGSHRGSHRRSDRINMISNPTTNSISNPKMDFNICIRTALVQNGYIEYWAGGGIVADSNPESEYEECLLKAERLLGII